MWPTGGRLGEHPIIVEEFMPMNLQSLLDEDGPGMTYHRILKIGLDVARGIDHLHRHHVVHYDIKPENLLLDEALNAKLADFTCSRFKVAQTISASHRGTIGYIAPECMSEGYVRIMIGADRHVRAEKIDVYSFGKVLLKCVTGELYHMNAKAASLCQGKLWKLICECVCLDSKLRPTCGEVVRRLEEMVNGDMVQGDWRSRRPKQDIWELDSQ